MSDNGTVGQSDNGNEEASRKGAEAHGFVFEGVDATSDEQYWSLGIWPTMEDAIAAFSDSDDPNDFGCHDHEDYDEICRIEIRKRKLGWGGLGTTVATIAFEHSFDEENDRDVWKRLQIEQLPEVGK